jgi:serine/threonine protein kinase/tetratricopeptide (TPR) repeat protein
MVANIESPNDDRDAAFALALEALERINERASRGLYLRCVAGLSRRAVTRQMDMTASELDLEMRVAGAWVRMHMRSASQAADAIPMPSNPAAALIALRQTLASPDSRDAATRRESGTRDANLNAWLDKALLLAGVEDDLIRAKTFIDTSPAVQRMNEDPLPERIGPYKVDKLLGKGGMGVVYLALQEMTQRPVAIKTLSVTHVDATRLRRFEREIELLGRLQHIGIAQVFAAGVELINGVRMPYFAMEYVKGESLTAYCARRNLGPRDCMMLLVEVARAVEHANEKGIVHRDLKPSNILVDTEGRTKVLDFGVARYLRDDTTEAETLTGQIVGTLEYMCPEQVQGKRGIIDERADVYALGVVGFELLAKQRPFRLDPKDLDASVRLIVEEEPPKLSIFGAEFRGDLETVFAKALEKDPARRYRNATEFAADLQRWLAGEPVVARPRSTLYQLRLVARRHRALATAFVSLISCTFIGLIVWGRIERRHAAEAAAERDDYERVVQLLVETAEQSISSRGGGPERTLVDALDAIRPQLARVFRRAPMAEFKTRMALAGAFLEAGRLLAAEEDARRALELAQNELAGRDRERYSAQTVLAAVLVECSRFEEALQQAHTATTGLVGQYGYSDPDTVRALSVLAIAQRESGSLSESESGLRAIIALCQASAKPDLVAIARARSNLGRCLRRRGDYVGAEEQYRAGLLLEHPALGAESVIVLGLKGNLATVLDDLRSSDAEAEALFRECLDAYKRKGIPDNRDAIGAASNFAIFLKNRNRLAEAEPFYRESRAATKRQFAPDHPRSLVADINLAQFLRAAKKPAEAVDILHNVIELASKKLPEAREFLVTATSGLARALIESGRAEEAGPYFLESVALRRVVQGAHHSGTLATLRSLAELYQSLEAPEFAEDALRELAGGFDHSIRVGDRQGAAGMCELARLLVKMGRPVEAEEILRPVLDAVERKYGVDDDQTVSVLVELSDALGAQNRWFDAALFACDAAERRGRRHSMDSADSIVLGTNHAAALASGGFSADALGVLRPLLLRAQVVCGPNDPTTGRIARDISQLELRLSGTSPTTESKVNH